MLNFDPEVIKVNERILGEIVQIREESLFSWQHGLVELNGTFFWLILGHGIVISIIFSLTRYIQLTPAYSVSQDSISLIVLQNLLMKSWMTGKTSMKILNLT